MDPSDLRSLLRAGPILSDGGMGTSLVELGVPLRACFEALNADDPQIVERAHRRFVDAGARLVLTNTFGANRFALARRGLEDRVAELNRAGVEIARGTGAVVAGSVGPLRVRLAPYGRVRPAEAFDAFAEQIEALAGAGADLVVIETQYDLGEVEQAVAAARKVSDLAVVATVTFTRDDRTLMGDAPDRVARRLVELGADAIGVNCGEGPAQALRVIRAFRPHADGVPLVVRPNAGGPQQVGGRFLYPATPAYFAEHAAALLDEGVAILGGCCGTGPEHIRAIAEVLEAPRRVQVEVVDAAVHEAAAEVAAAPTELSAKLASGRFVVAVEVDPPRGFSTAGIVAAAETLAEAGADVVNVADSPMARMRMSPWAACRVVQEQVGVETVLHFPTRGRNLLRLQGDLLGVHALGVRNLFVCLGDPIAIGDYPGGTDHVDVAPTGLIALITQSFNRGLDRSGASIGEPTSFVVGCAVNPNAPDLDRECRLLRRKIEAGAAFALTQPVFSVDEIERLLGAYAERHGEELTLPILAGVLPLMGSRHAEFLHNEVPGIVVPDELREAVRRAGEGGREEGLRIAVDIVAALRERVAGLFVVPQFGRFDVAAELVEAAKRR